MKDPKKIWKEMQEILPGKKKKSNIFNVTDRETGRKISEENMVNLRWPKRDIVIFLQYIVCIFLAYYNFLKKHFDFFLLFPPGWKVFPPGWKVT